MVNIVAVSVLPPPGSSTMGAVIRCLGGVNLEVNGRRVPMPPQMQRLLAVLIVEKGRTVTVDVIVDRLWDDRPPKTATKVIHVLVGRLRRLLGPTLEVVTAAGGYRLDGAVTDLDRFTNIVAEAERLPDADVALRALADALDLWSGRPWGEHGDAAWLRPARDAAEERYRRALELWGDLMLQTGRPQAAIARLTTAVEAEPLREHRWEQLMLALYRCGRQSDALRAYERARTVLRDELGIEPGPGIRRLHLAMLQQDSALEQRDLSTLSEASSFVGRCDELARVEASLVQHRVVTLVGLGGIGKTRLAAEFAHRRSLRGDPVRWASLRGLVNRDQLAEHVAESLGVHVEDGESAARTIAAALGEAPLLLVLDSAEGATFEAAELVLRLIEACPRARVLVTSRVAIGLPCESSVDVGPLPMPADDVVQGTALELLLDRMGFRSDHIDDERRAQFVGVCAASGGVPLLIELHARSTTLGDHSQLMPHGHDEAVRSAIETALGAVDEHAAELSMLISPFPGGVDEAMAARIAGIDVNVARRALRQLAWSNLTKPTLGRSTLRHQSLDPIRHELIERLTAEGRERAVARATEQTTDRFRALSPGVGPVVTSMLDGLEDEHGNVRFLLHDRLQSAPFAALSLAVAVSEFWPIRGHIVEGRHWLERALASARPEGPARWEGVIALARTTRTFAEVAALRVRLEDVMAEMVGTAAAEVDGVLLASGMMYLAMARAWSGDRTGALEAIARASVINDRIGNEWTTARIDQLRCLDRALGGDVLGARDGQREYARAMERAGDPVNGAIGWYLAATLADMAGVDDYGDDVTQARALATSYGDVSLLSQLLRVEAGRLRRIGDNRSRALLGEAVERLEAAGGVRAAALARRDLAMFDYAAGDLVTAAEGAHTATVRLLRLDRQPAALAVAVIAAVAVRMGHEGAARLARAAVDLRANPIAPITDDAVQFDVLHRQLPEPALQAVDDEELLAVSADLLRGMRY